MTGPFTAARYLDARSAFARWIIFGERPNGTVDIYEPLTDDYIATEVPREMAEKIIEARNVFIDTVAGLFPT